MGDRQAGHQRHGQVHQGLARLIDQRKDQRHQQDEADIVEQRNADDEAGDGQGQADPLVAEPPDQHGGDLLRRARVGDQLAEYGAQSQQHGQRADHVAYALGDGF